MPTTTMTSSSSPFAAAKALSDAWTNAATAFDPFKFQVPAQRNPADPDQTFVDVLERQRGATLVYGMTGNVWAQSMVVASARAVRGTWMALQLNPMTAALYDGKVSPPNP